MKEVSNWEHSGANKGQIYTRPEIVEFMLAALGLNKSGDLEHTRILEPSCGEGEFVVAIAERLIYRLEPKPTIEQLMDRMLAVDLVGSSLEIAKIKLREALEQALQQATPEMFNSDQGSQCTSRECTDCLKNAGIAISMAGRGRVFDNILIERMWRSVKWENIYLYDYEDVVALKQGLRTFFLKYNTERPHHGLAYATPAEVYFGCHAGMKQAQGGLV